MSDSPDQPKKSLQPFLLKVLQDQDPAAYQVIMEAYTEVRLREENRYRIFPTMDNPSSVEFKGTTIKQEFTPLNIERSHVPYGPSMLQKAYMTWRLTQLLKKQQ